MKRHSGNVRVIFCAGCGTDVWARLTDGAEIYPHRADLADLPFWKCGDCGNYVGCHYQTADRTRPLGIIPTPQLRKARSEMHKVIDPLWKSGRVTRRELYAELSRLLGRTYHTAELRSLDECGMITEYLDISYN